MPYKMVYVWLEGSDDVRFFERIVKPRLEKKYDTAIPVAYAQMKKEKAKNYLRSIASMPADYFFMADINNSPCVSHKKAKIKRYIANVNHDRIIVVKKEIESWYLAGLTAKDAKELSVPISTDTEDISKGDFDQLIPKEFASRIDFMIELLNRHNYRTARMKNRSFKYFSDKQK